MLVIFFSPSKKALQYKTGYGGRGAPISGAFAGLAMP